MRALTWLALRGCLYPFWSRVYRFLAEHRHLDKRLPPFSSMDQVKEMVGAMRWRRDTWLMLWDAISHPVATYTRHQAGRKAGDCDDISLVAAQAIKNMSDSGAVDDVVEVGLLSVPWIGRDGIGGHNVCVLRVFQEGSSRSRWMHMSNWANGAMFGPFDTLEDVVRDVLDDRISLGWAYWSTDLKLKRYGSGKTIGRQR